jgi:ABC-type antimicrobial peptide transport system permease subunit
MFASFSSFVRCTARLTALVIAAIFIAFLLGEPNGSLRVIQPREWAGMILLFAAMVAMLLAWKWEFPAALISLFALGAFAAIVHMNRYDVLAVCAIPNLLYLFDWTIRHLHSTPVARPS